MAAPAERNEMLRIESAASFFMGDLRVCRGAKTIIAPPNNGWVRDQGVFCADSAMFRAAKGVTKTSFVTRTFLMDGD